MFRFDIKLLRILFFLEPWRYFGIFGYIDSTSYQYICIYVYIIELSKYFEFRHNFDRAFEVSKPSNSLDQILQKTSLTLSHRGWIKILTGLETHWTPVFWKTNSTKCLSSFFFRKQHIPPKKVPLREKCRFILDWGEWYCNDSMTPLKCVCMGVFFFHKFWSI